jgi:hypothetical protein
MDSILKPGLLGRVTVTSNPQAEFKTWFRIYRELKLNSPKINEPRQPN